MIRVYARKDRNSAKAGIDQKVFEDTGAVPSSKLRPVNTNTKITPDGKTSMQTRRGILVEIQNNDQENVISKELFSIFSPEQVDNNDENSSPENYTTRRQRGENEHAQKCLFGDDEDKEETTVISLNNKTECYSGKRYPSQKQVMSNKSANEYLLDQKVTSNSENNIPRWMLYFSQNPTAKYEWLHLIAFSLFPKADGTPQTKNNLAAGTYEANTEMIIWEQTAASLRKSFDTNITANFSYFNGGKVIDEINYKIGIKYHNFTISLNFFFKDFDKNSVTGKSVDLDIAMLIVKYAMKQLDNQMSGKKLNP